MERKDNMGRLQELAQSIKGLETMGQFAEEDDASYRHWHIESTQIVMELAHEKVLQLTRIANFLEAAMPEGAITVGHMEFRVKQLEAAMDGLQTVVDDLFTKATEHIAEDVSNLDTQETEAVIDDDPFKDGPDVIRSPYYDPFMHN